MTSSLWILTLSILPSGNSSSKNYPLLGMKLMLVNERTACKLPRGYDSINSQFKCPELIYDEISALENTSVVAQVKPSPPSPPDQPIHLSESGLSDRLNNYRRRMQKANLTPEERLSMVVIFDFGDPSDKRNSDLELTINWQQSGKGCNGQDLAVMNGKPYFVSVRSDYRYLIYHQSADQFIPCSSVTWEVTAVEKNTKNQYDRWSFKTVP